jgi:hypothetical protein
VRTCAVPGRAGLIAGIDVRLPDELADSGGEWLLVSAKTRNGRIENRLRIKTIERERMAGPLRDQGQERELCAPIAFPKGVYGI